MEIQTSGKPIESLLEKVHCMNIISSDYFKELYRLSTYHEVIDEIYNQVDNVEPWMNGNCRGPSTAFCLLYKFFTMKLTVKQMDGLLKHPDSPYIRAIGFLYLRYLADPKSLWTWFESYVTDEEEFSPGTNGQVTTMGVYVRDLLLGQFYFDTLFPRIPVLIMRQIVANLERMKLPTKQSGITGESVRHGSDDIARRPPSVKAALSVSFGQRAPHRASTRPVQRTLPLPHGRNGSDDVRRSPRNRCSQTQEFSDRDQERGRDRDRDREDRDREREWDRNRVRQKERDRDRDRIRERDRDKRHEFEYDRHDNHESRNYYKSKYVDQERERGRRDCEKSSHDSRHRESSSRRSRSRSRSLQVHNHHSSPLRDGSKEKASASCNLAKLRDLYGDTGDQKGYSGPERVPKDSSGEEVIRLGGSTWK